MITVHLLKPSKHTVVTYAGDLLQRSATHILIRAVWSSDESKDFGFVSFDPGDVFYEHYYTNQWYNIFEVHASSGALKGWYCNVSRPAVFSDDVIDSEDLELDLFVPPDRQNPVLLDEDEYTARAFETTEPATHAAALAALNELRRLAAHGEGPFAEEESVKRKTY